jgi:N-acylglucosamine 2-epimerase
MWPRIRRYRESLDHSTNFWLNHSLDREFGGYWTCLTREGQPYDQRKYVWLMGRAVWMLSKLGRADEARPILDFLLRHARDAEGRYYFSLERDGRPAAFQRKPYGAVFVCIGLAEFARATGEQRYLDQAVELFWQIRKWIADPTLLGRPRHGLSQLADVMVTISMLQEIMPSHQDPRYADLLNAQLDEALSHQHPDLGVFTENIRQDGARLEEYPHGRLWCPGHALEVAWFLLRVLDVFPDGAKAERVYTNMRQSLELGWDREYGGLYYFLDTKGLPMHELEWDMKLWWPHTEAILALAHAWRRTEDHQWADWLDRMDDYSWRVFVDDPGAPEKAGVPGVACGEWFGYADRSGRITQNAKGNHYKGFFHVPRAMWGAAAELESAITASPK